MLNTLKRLLEEKKFTEALSLSSSEENILKDPLFYLYKGVAALELRQLDLSEQYLLKAIELDKKIVASHKNLALVYYLKKSPEAYSQLLLSSWLDPLDIQTFQLILKLNTPSYPDADVVLYTASPYWNLNISPDGMTQSGLGGSETAFIQMAQELSRLGKKVICFCSIPERKNFDGVEYIPVVEFFLFNHLKLFKNFISSRFLYPLQFPLNADKKILWMHDIDGGLGDEKVDFKNIDLFLALSEYQTNFLINEKKYPQEKFIKVKNGFSQEHFSHSPSSQKIPHSLIYFSRPSRGLAEAVRAFRLIRKQIPDASLHVCSYSVREKIEDDPDMLYLMSLKAEEGVVVHGSLSKTELAQLLQKNQICLYPNTSNLETFCIVAIEAMAAGLPVVSSDRGSLAEIVANDKGGKIIPFRQDESFIQELADHTLRLLENPEEYAKLSQSARERAWQHFTWKKAAEEWLAFLR